VLTVGPTRPVSGAMTATEIFFVFILANGIVVLIWLSLQRE
jgi:hypothetical protein